MQETASGASQKRPLREEVTQLARARAVDVILVAGRSRQPPEWRAPRYARAEQARMLEAAAIY